MLTKERILNIEKYKGRQVHLRRLFNKIILLRAGMKLPVESSNDDSNNKESTDSLLLYNDDDDDSELFNFDRDRNPDKYNGPVITTETDTEALKEKRKIEKINNEKYWEERAREYTQNFIGLKRNNNGNNNNNFKNERSSLKKVSSQEEGSSSLKKVSSSSKKRKPSDDKTITIRTHELERVAPYEEGDRCTDAIDGFGGLDANGRIECQTQNNWKIVKMTPMDFLLMANMIPKTEPECKRIATVKELMKTHKPQIPYLEIGNIFNLPKVSGHSGRHRVYEFLSQRCKTIDVAISCQFSQGHLFRLNTENGKHELHIQAEDNTGILGVINIINLNEQSCNSDGNTLIVQPGEAVKEKKNKIIEMRRWSDVQEYTIVREGRRRKKKQRKNKKRVDQY